MNRFLLLAVVSVLAISSLIFGPALSKVEGAIVYSGSQNVTLQLKGGPNLPAPPAEMAMISIAGASERWDDFTIILEYVMGMPGMTMTLPKTRLTIFGGMSMSMGSGMAMGEVIGLDMAGMGVAFNLPAGAAIGPDSPTADNGLPVLLSEAMRGQILNGEFGAMGGYIGLVLPGSEYYAWLHLANMSNVGENNQRATIDGWAYEDVPGTPIDAGDIISETGPCGWQRCDPYKMHFPQLPDPQGWDVAVTSANALADDWKCTQTGSVSDIHFWYSWQQDRVGVIQTVRVRIYANVPADKQKNLPSMPGEILWERSFSRAEFQTCYWGEGTQGFMQITKFTPNDHKRIFQCDITNIPDPFVQQEGTIYWLGLMIAIQDTSGAQIGWKTSQDHFEDDAVYDAGGRWAALHDPRTGESLDLAFVITGEKVPEPGIKWAQRPEIALCNVLPGCFYGWDEISVYADKQIVADDWLCSDDRPVTDIHWWGSFKGWASQQPPPQMPAGFHISIWTDVPATPGATGFSHPGKVVWQTYCKDYTWKFVGWDVDPHNMAPPWEATFYFEYDLPEAEWFWQDPSVQIYWISISADYAPCPCNADFDGDGDVDLQDFATFQDCYTQPPTGSCAACDLDCDGDVDLSDFRIFQCQFNGPNRPANPGCCPSQPSIEYPWGWKTRRRDAASAAPDDAVIIFKPTNPTVGDTFQQGRPIYWPTPDRSWDMAFVLTTGGGQPACGWNVGDPHKMHFPQLPDSKGWDVDVTYANILADDWKCTQTGSVSDIHFWYSWLGDKIGTIANIRASIWSNIPADGKPGSYSQPGKVLWERDFKADQFRTCYWGSGDQGFMMGNEGRANDHKQIFQCNIVDIPDPFIQREGTIYWLSLSLWIQDPVGTHIGWKTSSDHYEDDAVHGSPGAGWAELRDPLTRESLDLAFVITGEGQPPQPKSDLGDAPDSTNTWATPMTAYPKGGPAGVVAKYPTVFQIGSPPHGPIHWQPLAVAYLGQAVSLENEADAGPDQDGTNNIVPAGDAPDLDKADDGVAVPLVLPHCELTSFDYLVTVVPLATIEPPPLYVNVWFDWNRDGDWDDTMECQGAAGVMPVPEWAVRNQELNFVTHGQYNVTTPKFMCWNPATGVEPAAIWMRITLSERQWGMVTSAARVAGDGPTAGYEYGETEDYYFVPEVPPPEPKPPAEHLKWSQPPIEWNPTSKTPYYCGWDEPSFAVKPGTGVPPSTTVWNIVADDFRCLGSMPVTSVHWWGSYEGWNGREPPKTAPTAWQIGFWSNVAANPDVKPGFSHPGKLLWQMEIPADRVHEEWAGIDRFQEKPSDTCFQYYVQLKPREYFWQQKYVDSARPGDVFWISITAIYPPILIPYPQWGWKTRPQHWMDDAVRFRAQGEFPTGFSNEFGIKELTSTLCGQIQSYDMAFELDTDPNYIKWEQAYTGIRDWPHYEDEESLAIETTAATKWTQKPDLSETGMDVDATDDIPPTWSPQALADDFKCATTGAITHIRVWGSWYNDILPARFPENVVFKLVIYEDIPASQSPTRHSMPGKLLWSRDFKSGEFAAIKYAERLKEGWYVPCKPIYEPSADTICWQFDFDMDRSQAFIQRQGTIYWLAVQAQVVHAPMTEATRFGWKTSADHWNDDAVWRTEIMPISRPWEELLYPQRHPLEGKSIDLAFELSTEAQKEQLQIRRLIADDWLCTRITPVTAIVWWGSYIGYQYEACQCQQMTPPAKPDYFLLSVWTDVPASSAVPYSHPREKVWEYKAYDYDEVLVGYDKHPEISRLDVSFPSQEPVFRYSVQLPKENWFCQKNVNNVYWLSIVAVYKNAQEALYPWGWTNHKCTTWDVPGLTEVLHWKLDETSGVTATDDSGNNNHGTLVGDANWAACCGHLCGAIDLDGKGDYVKVDTPTGLNFTPGSFSASAWIRAREVTGGWRTIMEYDRDGWDRNRFGMWLTDDGRFHFRVGWDAWQTNQKLNADQWYMLTGTYDSKTKKFSMYVNGQFDIAADLQKGFTSANVAKLTVGVRGSEDGEYFNGLIDDVRIYNYALSADQVKALYDASRNDDAVAGHMVTDATGASTWVWQELYDQVGMSEDMSFILFTEPGCFPCTYSTYGEWLASGKPDCWCAPPNGSGYQCDGDADGKDSGGINKFRVFTGDLNLVVANWKKKAGDAALNPCADIDHKDSGGINKFRVFTGDLNRLVTNWKKKDAQLPGDCPRPE